MGRPTRFEEVRQALIQLDDCALELVDLARQVLAVALQVLLDRFELQHDGMEPPTQLVGQIRAHRARARSQCPATELDLDRHEPSSLTNQDGSRGLKNVGVACPEEAACIARVGAQGEPVHS
jgi:hypothetical protein